MTAPPSTSSPRYYLLAAALLVMGCSASSNLIGPENQLEVNNAPDTFQWQVSTLSDVTQTLTYSWVNNGTVANVNQSSSLGSGSADLQILDSGGVEVYAGDLTQDGTFQTRTGAPGSWTVTVTLTKANGALNFRLQKP